MKKIVVIVSLAILAILALPAYLFLSGTIGTSSIAMMLNVMTGKSVETPPESVLSQRFKLPPGFSMNVYARDLPKARFIRFTQAGDLLVTRPYAGDVILIRRNEQSPTVAGERVTLLEGLTRPSGIDVFGNWLYVGESNAVGRVPFDADQGVIAGDYEHIITGLTDDGNHPYKVIGIGPDQKLYLGQGSTCNVCVEEDIRRGTLSTYNLDGTDEQVFATGLRNSMGMDWAPWNDALYATDNGRDMLGDDYPPCELNKLEAGNFYGWPYYNGANEPDPDYGKEIPSFAANAVAPAHEFRAHNAPLGMSFVDSSGWPQSYNKVAMAALHGSWNRSSPDGYKVVSLHWNGDNIQSRDFLTGFEKDGDIIGRPVDVAQGPDGAIYISDDYAGAIYRVSYGESSDAPQAVPKASETDFVLGTPDWLDDDNITDLQNSGEALFKQNLCASCHNPRTAVGRLALHNVNERLQHAELIDALTRPTAPMPALPLSEDEKRALAVYLLNPR
ncbi:MAG: glucose/arabinose dehydrogenase [Cryomorphaceae bacterium]|jgi:glucose/arabinose dehydrogenase